jgi:hypothetical protein
MNFKFLRGEEEYGLLQLEPSQVLTINRPTFTSADVEFCFQFGDEEPVVFGQGPNDLQIHVSPTPDGYVMFNNNGKTFKIFARERVNE